MNKTTAAIQIAKRAVNESDLDWPDIIEALTGVELERNKHSACPIHDGLHPENRDGFRMVKLSESGGEDGVFHCAGKGNPHSGDSFEIIHRLLGGSKLEVAEMVFNAAGGSEVSKEKSEKALQRQQERDAKAKASMDEKQAMVVDLYACAVKRSKKLERYVHPYAQRKGLTSWTELAIQRRDYERIVNGTESEDTSLLMVVPRCDLESRGICGLEFITEHGNKWTVGRQGYASVPYHNPGTYVAVVEGYATAVKTQQMLTEGGAHHIRVVAAGGKHSLAKTAQAFGEAFVVAEYDAGGYSQFAVPHIQAPYSDAGNDACDWQDDEDLVTQYFNLLVRKATEMGATEHRKETLEDRWERVFKYWDRWGTSLTKPDSYGVTAYRESRGIA